MQDTTANAFAVDIDSEKLVNHLKEAIKEKNIQTFANRNRRVLARETSKKSIHVIVSPPESVGTSSREQEILEQLATLQALLNKSIYEKITKPCLRIAEFDVIVSPKRIKSFKWTINIEHEGLKDSILKTYRTPALENDGAVLSMLNDSYLRPLRNAPTIRIQVYRSHRDALETI
ncbi:hypothetical protein C1645_876288 [Glomus cerebriforme]|uniref:Crinkler effector protein N-terminal domain-containing protein n=1 Tax=Glomus cerebriforme TaxID=658196 RepID=A0A397SVV6_9GLOM|nr:hypothetical protein C1645_876288 [Glomus cerebriforme]